MEGLIERNAESKVVPMEVAEARGDITQQDVERPMTSELMRGDPQNSAAKREAEASFLPPIHGMRASGENHEMKEGGEKDDHIDVDNSVTPLGRSIVEETPSKSAKKLNPQEEDMEI